MTLSYIDVHSHIHGKEYDADRDEVIARMKEAGVITITVGTALGSSKKAVELAEKNDGIYATIGVHPTDTEEIFDEKNYETLIQSKKVVAIGECGLDYYRPSTVDYKLKERQKDNFVKQLEFALKCGKPLMIHCRPSEGTVDAHEDMISILKSYLVNHKSLRGNIHFFTAGENIAAQYFNLGFTVSIPGVVTFAQSVAEVIAKLPLDKILSETDCPYATPVPFRGKRNEPAYVIETVKKIAALHQKPIEEVGKQMLSNAVRVFGI